MKKKFTETIGRYDSWNLHGFVGDVSPRTIKKYLDGFVIEPNAAKIVGRKGSSSIPVAAVRYRDEIEMVISNIDGQSTLSRQKCGDIVDAMSSELLNLSRLSGDIFVLDIGSGEPMQPFDDGLIHVVVGAMPPGQSVLFWGSHICEIQLAPMMQEVRLSGIAHGYGTMVDDDHGNRIAQIVGSTIYLCLPFEKEHVHLLAGRGTHLFREVLNRAWNLYVIGDEPATKRITSEFELETFYSEEKNALRVGYTSEFEKIDTEIAALQQKINELVRKRASYVRGMEVMENMLNTDTAQFWSTLGNHPAIDYIEHDLKGAIHFHTRSIVMENDDGISYNVGSFVIRLVLGKGVYIWAKKITHQDRVPHPHISKQGSTCFGNVQTELNHAILERRDLDAIELTLDWLTSGYDARLTYNKLEEWPLALEGINSERTC